MGTSRNDPSPNIPPWKMANSILGRKNITADRQSTQMWRAAIAERGEQIINDFGHPVLAAACKIANEYNDVSSAVNKYNELLADNYESGLNLDMGRRALIRTINSGGKAIRFASELFSEAVSYYASRDLPSVVGTKGRISNASELIELKNSFRQSTQKIVLQAGSPRTEVESWRSYVESVMTLLKGVKHQDE